MDATSNRWNGRFADLLSCDTDSGTIDVSCCVDTFGYLLATKIDPRTGSRNSSKVVSHVCYPCDS